MFTCNVCVAFFFDLCHSVLVHRAVIRQFSSKRDCGEFDQEGTVFTTHIDKYQDKIVVLMAGPDMGDLVAFDLSKKSLKPDKAYGFLIKSKNRMRIPKPEREKLEKLACNNDASGNNSNNRLEYMRVQLICSAYFDYAIAIYQNTEIWVAYLYHIYHGRRLGSYVSQVSIMYTRIKKAMRLIAYHRNYRRC